MKKLAIFVAAIALTLGLAQCKKEQTPTGTGETVRITLNVGDNASTPSTGSGAGGSKADVNPNANQITFAVGDQILVAYDGKYVGTLTGSEAGDDVQFSGDITITENVENPQPLFFYFLGNKQGTVANGATTCTVNISDQTTSAGLPVISMGRSVDNTTDNNIVNYDPEVSSYTARLYNKCSLMKFTVNLPSNAPEGASTAAVCITGMKNEVTVNFGDPTDSGFSYSKNPYDGGLIKMPAKNANNETWAIVLPQPALAELEESEGGFGTIYTEDPTQYANCYLGEVRPAICEIEVNKIYNGVNNTTPVLTMHTPRLVNLANITAPNFGSTDYNVQNGQVLTGKLKEDSDGFFNPLDGGYRICIVDGATVTLSGVTIHGDSVSQNIPWAGLTCLGDATIILEGDNKVNGFNLACPGILPGEEGKTLTIKGSGTLKAKSAFSSATGGPHAAGIGCGTMTYPGYVNTSCGNIRIEGGHITATGGYKAAGIGTSGVIKSGDDIIPSTCGNITIIGGTIRATGGSNAAGSNPRDTNNAAGIGAGSDGYCSSINIGGSSSGTATSAGDYYSIGGLNLGNNVVCPSVTIFRNSGHHLSDLGHSCSWTSDGVVTILVP